MVASWSGSRPRSYRSRSGTGREPRRLIAQCHAGESSAASTSRAFPPGRPSTSRASAARFWTWSSISGPARQATGAGRRYGWMTKAGVPCSSLKGWGMPSPPSARRRPSSTCARRRTHRDASTACTPLMRTSALIGRRTPNPPFPRRTPPRRRSRRRAAQDCCPSMPTARPTWMTGARRPKRGSRYRAFSPATVAAR